MGDPSEPSKSSSPKRAPQPLNDSDSLAARLDNIASMLERLLEVSTRILDHVHKLENLEPRSRQKREEAVADFIPRGVDLSTLLDLPDHLRKPLMTMYKLGGRGTAGQVSEKLGISRPQASATLNSLVRLGLLEKKREGREGRRGADAIFMIHQNRQ